MKWKNTILLLIVTAITIVLYLLFLRSFYYQLVETWIQSNVVLFVSFLFLFKFISIIWPPLTGGLATLASIPLIGWELAYFVDLSGSIAGGVVAYYLGKKYGYRILNKLFDEKVIEKIKKIKVKENREFEAVFVYRTIFGATILEAIYYGAGFLRVNFNKFLLASVLSHMLIGVPTYYLTKNVLEGGNTLIVIISIVLAIPLFTILKKRYFEL